VDVCYLLPSAGTVQLEEDLGRAVMVTIAGSRPEVSLDTAAAAIHA
jgi:hypothetical protein